MPKSQRPSSSTHSNTFSPLSRPSRSGTHQQTRSSSTSADEEVEDVASRADEILERLHTTRNGNRQTRQSKLSIRRDKDALKVEAARLKKMAKLFAERAAKIEEALKGLNDDIPEPDASQGQSMQNPAHHPAQQSDSLTVQNSTQHSALQPASRNPRQTARNAPRKTTPTSSPDSASESGTESGSEFAPGSTRESSPDSTSQTKRKTVRRIKPQPPTQQAAYSAPRRTTRQPPRPTTRQFARPTTRPTRRQPAQQVILTAESSSRSSGSNSAFESDLNLWSACSTMSTIRTGVAKRLNYNPHRALLHQFKGMDQQMVVSYGKTQLQIWDTAGDNLFGADGEVSACRTFEQIEPVSSGLLAVVSDRSIVIGQEDSFGGLSFARVKWSTSDRKFITRFSDLWKPDGLYGGKICVVEPAVHADNSNEDSVALFTGGGTEWPNGGGVCRRSFDIRDGVELASTDNMRKLHRGSVISLCHIEEMGYIMSGSTRGTIHCNDEETGKCIQELDVDDCTTVSSITRCPFSHNLFLVGFSHPMSELHVYDLRTSKKDGKPELVLTNGNDRILPNARPIWNPNDNRIYTPMTTNTNGVDSGIVKTWDSRYVKDSSSFTQLSLPENVKDAFSVALTKSDTNNSQTMITASSKALSYVPITNDIVNCYQ